MSRFEADLTSRAIVVWTGWGAAMIPGPDEARLIGAFGVDLATDLLPELNALYNEFFQSTARYTAQDTNDMGIQASVEFAANHPEISDEAVKALAACYTFNYK